MKKDTKKVFVENQFFKDYSENFVLGSDNTNASNMLIGEAPGEKEDKQRKPFVGPAGKNLDELLNKFGLSCAENIYITNAVKYRPPKNEIPCKCAIKIFAPYLKKEIEFVNPKLIVTLEKIAAKSLIELGLTENQQPVEEGTVRKMRGKPYKYKNIGVIVTYHIRLQNNRYKKQMEEDFSKL